MAEKLKTVSELFTPSKCADCNKPQIGISYIDKDTLNAPISHGILKTYVIYSPNIGNNVLFQECVGGMSYGGFESNPKVIYYRTSTKTSNPNWDEWITPA